MDPITEQLNERFAPPSGDLGPVITGELQSILRIHSIDPEELSYKWESYCMKMGAEETTLDLKTVRDFKKDLQEALERETRGKVQPKGSERRTVGATPRAGMSSGDVFGALDGLLPNTPHSGARKGINGSTAKRRTNFETPAAKSNRGNMVSSPSDLRGAEELGTPLSSFSDRKDAGAIIESLNPNIELAEPTDSIPAESRFKLKANTEISKFSYKTMAMKLSEASEILDDRIDEVATVIQQHYKLEDSAFGNPASQSQNEIVVVGRIASDTSEGILNTAALVLETSRRTGAGLRVPLKVENLKSYQFFPGKIVALKGTNASAEFFSVTEMLDIPQLFPVATSIDAVDVINDRIAQEDGSTRSLVTIVASGPYTTDQALDFSPFQALLGAILDIKADGLILCGPFIDSEHPLIRTGDFDLPENYPVSPDKATLSDLFKAHISSPLNKLCQALPTISIVLCPSVRDVISKHAAWPQDRFVKRELSLPRQVAVVPNPMLLSLNEIMFGMSSQDVLSQLQASEIAGGQARYTHVMDRLTRQLIEQRHFFPVLPPVERQRVADTAEGITYSPLGAMLDISYLKLGEWLGVKPDVLITPSILPPFAKVIEGVVSINPGTLSKKRGPGTYARMTIQPLIITDEERDKGDVVGHRVFDRCRVDIVKI